jgi:hypothetical protein
MSFAGWLVPSPARTIALRGGGAPGDADPSSFSRTAVITRMVAVAWATALAGCGGGGEKIAARAANSIGMTPNALDRDW